MANIKELVRLINLARGERTQNEFALHCGFSSSAISKIKARGVPPQPYILKKIAKHAYNGVSYADLMIASGYMTEPYGPTEPQVAICGGNKVALRLKEARKNAGLTQQQVADMVGISQNNYSYWENEKVKIDNLSLQRLASIFGVSVDYLLGVDEQPEPQVAFSGGADDLTEDEIAQVQDFIAYLKSKRK